MTTPHPLRILLLSGYHAASHRYWCDGLMRELGQYHWTLLSLPARHFSWRLRGNPLSWLSEQAALLNAPYDLVIATSAVDVATLRGLVPSLARLPWLLYMHENQFAYPRSARQHPGVDAQMVNLYAALSADRVLFNSGYNRDSFLAGANALLSRLPDHRPRAIEPLLSAKSGVLSVPLDDSLKGYKRQPADQFTLCWNHRWEYDKGPQRLLLTLRQLKAQRVPFRLHLLGEQFRQQPQPLLELQREFAQQLGQVGFVDQRERYYQLLSESHLVLSNSLHEFQGLAVLEAVALGSLPRVPARLSYPELFPDCCYPGDEQDEIAEAENLAAVIAADFERFSTAGLPAAPSVAELFWSALKPAYAAEIESLVRPI
ncbi:tRNA-queuosine alpha-mannosyltransferase domain-containing protein [Motiliproteus sediminis]|uniref:tRNA-queuosine alpha-mannosyltransferase domain-containing protein n=1 Tax=Motiliproteus sediminis TaxID=1468178 RepID=UPI001FE7A0CF|nr:DUF3524 domain-containing protein [Motiliproteus sediminis]